MQDLRIEAIKKVWEVVVDSYRMQALVAMLQSVKVDNILSQPTKQSHRDFMNKLGLYFLKDDWIDTFTNSGIQTHRPFVPKRIWDSYEAYISIPTTAFLIVKTFELDLAGQDSINTASIEAKIREVAPMTNKGFDEFGWTWMFQCSDTLQNLLLVEINRFIEGDHVAGEIMQVSVLNQSINEVLRHETEIEVPDDLRNPNN